MNSKTLTLAFSSLGKTLPDLLSNLNKLSLPDDVEILVMVQKPQEESSLLIIAEHIKIVNLTTVGLSRSRNAAIMEAKSNYIWFLDDDVQLTNSDIGKVLDIINTDSADFYRVKIGCIEWKDKTFKTYKPVNKSTKLNLLQISSIEIIANLDFIKKNELLFNENIGLGTRYQCNEENNFLIDAWDKGAKFNFIDEVLIRHTCIFEGRILPNNGIFEIKGATASRFGLLGALLVLRWSVRFFIKERKFSYVSSLVKGFVRGYSFYK